MRVLIVEDNNQLIQSVAIACKEKGWEVSLANSADRAMELLRSESVQTVLLDVLLPGSISGMDMLRQLKQSDSWKHIPVIIFTNLDTERDTAALIGADDYIVKANASLEDVVARISRVIHP